MFLSKHRSFTKACHVKAPIVTEIKYVVTVPAIFY